MTEKIILSILSIIMLVLTIPKKDKSTIIITSGLTIGILFTWIAIPIIITIGFIIYSLSGLISIIHGIKANGLNTLERIIIAVSGFWIITIFLFSFLHLPYANEIKLSMIIPLIGYLIIMSIRKDKQKA